MNKTCVFCNVADNLNTSLVITLEDGSKVTVYICDIHAEEATVKLAREAYNEKKKKIDDLIAQARSLGIELSDKSISQSKSGIVVVREDKSNQIEENNTTEEITNLSGPNVVPTARLNHRDFNTRGGSDKGYNISGYNSLRTDDLKDKLPEGALDGIAELAMVEGRSGQPITIPVRRVDKTGTTRMIVKKSTDAELQSRFKKMSGDTMRDKTVNFKDGYENTQRKCPVCQGMCSVKHGKEYKMCPKCNGSGIISLY